MATVRHQTNDLSMDDLKQISEGTGDFISQFRPRAMGMGADANQLMVDDKNYSSANDHYFGYMQTRGTDAEDKERQRMILKDISQHGDQIVDFVHQPLTDQESMTEDEYNMTTELNRRKKERDNVLLKFDCTTPEVVQLESIKRGFKGPKEFRAAIEESYWVHENPYEKPNLTKKEYKALDDMSL